MPGDEYLEHLFGLGNDAVIDREANLLRGGDEFGLSRCRLVWVDPHRELKKIE
jgi:hypothetical protein